MRRLLFVLFSLPAISWAAGAMIISDIDDTVKRTHMHSLPAAAINALKSQNQFAGMSELYLRFACANTSARLQCLRSVALVAGRSNTVAFVSASPGKLSRLGRRFIRNSGFPLDLFVAREGLSIPKRTYKAGAMNQLIQSTGQSAYVLIGDNGEQDPMAFSDVASNRISAQKNVFYYVHAAYIPTAEQILLNGQRYFLTAADLGVEFLRNGWIDEVDLQAVARIVLAHLEADDDDLIEAAIPSWMECRWFVNSYRRPNLTLQRDTVQMLDQIDLLTRAVCRAPGHL